MIVTIGKNRRHPIRLGRVSKKIAETARRMIESLEAAKAAGHSIDRETAEWVGRVSDEIHSRLTRAGLVPPRVKPEAAVATLGQHLDHLFANLGKQKPTTARNYARARGLLEEFFTRERPLDSITEADADGYKAWLLKKYAPASASVDLRRARQFLKAAVRRRLIPANPFAEVTCGSQVNDERIVYVPAEDIERVIAACPDNDWRLVLALPRYAGVRFPSEVIDLKWSDVDWENSRFTVRQKKLEHHPGRSIRVVPIFAELRPHLERAFREREEGAVYVLPLARITSNLGTHAKRLVTKAGVTLWPKFFTNMRGSCSDDLERRGVTEKAINAWIGNTGRIRQRHYHAVRPEDWAAVTGKAAQIPARAPTVSGHQEPSTLHEAREKSLDVQNEAEKKYPRQGSNL
ncbi:MAG: tyrosine-type recombinase/integrase [Planctomycetia bacterium]